MTAITSPGALQGYRLTTVTFEDVANLDGQAFGFGAGQPYAGLGLTIGAATIAAHANLASSSGNTAVRSTTIYSIGYENSLWWKFASPQRAVGFYYRDSLATSFKIHVEDQNGHAIETDTFPGGEGYAGVIRPGADIGYIIVLAPHATFDDADQSRTDIDDLSFAKSKAAPPLGKSRKFVLFLAWVWMILAGSMLITPGGVFCIVCGITPSAPGYIGNPAVTLIATMLIVLGILGFATSSRDGRG